ncbi:hypothetical protein Lal_00002877 [Lupinus albus]|uniref:Putative pectinesterase inhibitor domain-containing protein n=1 Tax=Lupinus albus TaxID=3870 RepID=A0A6A4NAQ5_LUPAL|nr:putative pectinesterase inhibitor domain-containing protein [Lupinus albus]KAF1882697.1 hypothetical protein Lal_00002877 [Lupinus albus]
MAPSSIHSLLLVLFLSFGVCISLARVVPVSVLCSKHPNPTNCVNILYNIDGIGAGIELPGSIPPYVINTIGHAGAFETYTLLNTLIRNATDPKLKQRYIACSADYVGTLDYFNSAKDAYTSANYKDMKSNAANVIKAVQDCDRRPPSDPSQLPLLNNRMQDVSNIIIILADFLLGKY